MALAAVDLFARIKASDPAAFRGFYALTVDDTHRRGCFVVFQLSRTHDQKMVDRLPQPGVTPVIEIVLNRR